MKTAPVMSPKKLKKSETSDIERIATSFQRNRKPMAMSETTSRGEGKPLGRSGPSESVAASENCEIR